MMAKSLLLPIVSCLLALLLSACTPKAAGPAETGTTAAAPASPTVKKPAADAGELSTCAKFTDAKNPGDAEDNYVIYRAAMKAKEMDRALKTWRTVYATSPAADGRRPTV